MNLKEISIVIPTFNRVKLLQRLLKSIDNQKIYPKEVIVINDGSNDKTEIFLENWEIQEHKYTSIACNNPTSQGPSVARNIGIQISSGDAIAFTDDDCIIHPTWIEIIINSKFWKNGKKIVGIGGRVLPHRRGIVCDYFTYHKILEPPRFNQYLVTANACYLRNSLIEVKGFDEAHKYPGGEDNGLSFKLANLGYTFGFEKKMIVMHDYRTSISSLLKTFYRYGKGCAEVTHKYFRVLKKKEGEL